MLPGDPAELAARRELAEDPEEELAELADLYVDRGLEPDLALQVARQLTEHDALAAHAPGSRFAPRRFRPNVVVHTGHGAEGFPENAWISEALVVGAGLNQFGTQHNLCNLGYWVDQAHTGRGLATAAVTAACDAARAWGLHRVEAGTTRPLRHTNGQNQ
mgnify:CR=1 FL=1